MGGGRELGARRFIPRRSKFADPNLDTHDFHVFIPPFF